MEILSLKSEDFLTCPYLEQARKYIIFWKYLGNILSSQNNPLIIIIT